MSPCCGYRQLERIRKEQFKAEVVSTAQVFNKNKDCKNQNASVKTSVNSLTMSYGVWIGKE